MVFYFICNEQFCFRWAARGSMKIIWTMWNCVLVKVDIVLPWTNTFGAYKADYWFGCFAQRRTWYSQSIVYFYIFFFIVFFFCFISPQTNVNDKRMGRQHQRRPNKKKTTRSHKCTANECLPHVCALIKFGTITSLEYSFSHWIRCERERKRQTQWQTENENKNVCTRLVNKQRTHA